MAPAEQGTRRHRKNLTIPAMRMSYHFRAAIRRLIKEPVARKAIRWLKENAPEWLPRIERQRGSRREDLFWQSGGGYNRNITDGNTLLRMINDIHEHPVLKDS